MKDAIERVIAELQQHIHKSDQDAKAAADEGSLYREGIHAGRGTAFSIAVIKLKAVLSEHETHRTD